MEANEELREFMHSNANFMDFGCKPLRDSTGDAIQSVYALTKILNDTKSKITPSENISYA